MFADLGRIVLGFAVLAGLVAACSAGCRCNEGACRRSDVATGLNHVDYSLFAVRYSDDLQALIAPPVGWTREIRDDPSARSHQVWTSASGRTAYGVMRFSLPLPVGHEPVLWVFMREMKRSEGEAHLLEKHWDANLRALRFVARGGLYTVRTSLLVRGFNGWAVYSGTLTTHPVDSAELALAERAKELTLVGRTSGLVTSDGAGR